MITTSDTVAIVQPSIVRFVAPDIRVVPQNFSTTSTVGCVLQVVDGDNVIWDALANFTAAEINATTLSSTGFVEDFQAACEKVAMTYLEGLTANSGATFSLV